MNTADMQEQIKMWVVTRLGSEAMRCHERGLRSSEENAELVQAFGVTREEAHRIIDRVFNKPVGDIKQELGGAMLTLLACAESAGCNLGMAAQDELDRIFLLPMEKFRSRQDQNVKDGIGEPRLL